MAKSSDNTLLVEGQTSVIHGMNQAVEADLLPDTQYAWGVNVSSRGGHLKTRPRWRQLDIFSESGVFQGAAVYRARTGVYIVSCISGTVYMTNLSTFQRLRVRTFPTVDFTKAAFQQADRYFIIQNGITRPTENWPIILDGETVVDNLQIQVPDPNTAGAWVRLGTLPDPETKRLPIGGLMAYGFGRLFVSSPRIWDNGLVTGTAQWLYGMGSRYFTAGSIIQPDNPDEVLANLETDYLSEGGAFSTPADFGDLKGFAFFRNAQTGTGNGELIAFAERGISAFTVSAPRDQWKSIQLAQVLFMDFGSDAARSIVPLNDDLWFRSRDGLRSIRYTSAQIARASGSLSNLPQSVEVQSFMDVDPAAIRPLVSAAYVTSRLHTTVKGTALDDGTVTFDGVLSLDAAASSSTSLTQLSVASAPAYDGVWTGLSVYQVLSLPIGDAPILCAVVRTPSGGIEYWVLDDEAIYDGDSSRPLCRVATRKFALTSPTVIKDFSHIDVWLSGLRGPCDITAYWRPDDYPLWTQTNAIHLDGCEGATGIDAQGRARIRLAATDRRYDPVTGRDTRAGFIYQFCLEWKGVATIEKVTFHAYPNPTETPNVGSTDEVCVPVEAGADTGVEIDMFDYEIDPWPAAISDYGFIEAPDRPVDVGFGYTSGFWLQDGQLSAQITLLGGTSDFTGLSTNFSFSSGVATLPGDSGSQTVSFSSGTVRKGSVIVAQPAGKTPQETFLDTVLDLLKGMATGEQASVGFGGIPPPAGFPFGGGYGVTYNPGVGGPVTKPIGPTPPGGPPVGQPGTPPVVSNDIVKGFLRINSSVTAKRGDKYTFTCETGQSVDAYDSAGQFLRRYTRVWPNAPLAPVTIQLSPGNGDVFTPATTQVQFDSRGIAYIDGVFGGGSTDPNITAVFASMVVGDSTIQSEFSPCTITGPQAGIAVSGSVAPVFVLGDSASSTITLTLSNTVAGSALKWSVTQVSVDAGLAGKITVSPTAYSGTGLAGGSSEPITVTITCPAALGTYAATLRFTDGIVTANVPVSVTVVPAYAGSLYIHLQKYTNGSLQYDYCGGILSGSSATSPGTWAGHSPAWTVTGAMPTAINIGRNSTTGSWQAEFNYNPGYDSVTDQSVFWSGDVVLDPGTGSPSGCKQTATTPGSNVYYIVWFSAANSKPAQQN